MHPGWPLPAALALLALGLAMAGWRARSRLARLREVLEAKSRDLENLQVSFARFAHEEIVERIVSGGVASQGERKEVTALFVDLVGFTALSERTEPDVLVRILNGYFERMSRAITDHRGYVSTFIGDGILALFGALQPNPWQGNDAVHAALAMREVLVEYNRELEAEGLPPLAIGVGLHRGIGVAALMGSRELMQFMFVGRIVNLAARVQDLTRQLHVDILLTRAVKETLDRRIELRALPATPVRGIAGSVEIFSVVSAGARDDAG